MLTEKKEARPAEGRASNAIQNDDTAPISLGATSIKIELLLSEVGASIGQIEAQLNCLAAMVAICISTCLSPRGRLRWALR